MKIINLQTGQAICGEIYRHYTSHEDISPNGANVMRWVTTCYLDSGLKIKLEEDELNLIHPRTSYQRSPEPKEISREH